MSVYMITYFLSDTHGHNHDETHEHSENCSCGENNSEVHSHGAGNITGKIKSLGTWAQFMPEGFFVKTNTLSAQEIFDEVNSVANKGDIIFVTKIEANTSACANTAVLAWLSEA